MKRTLSDDEQSQLTPAGLQVVHFDDELVLLSFSVADPALPDVLTAAEREVARLVYQGANNREIANARGVSAKTIGNQLESIYRKLGVSSRSELVLRLHAGRDEPPP